MTRFLGIASVLLVVLLAMAFAAVNAGQRVTLSLGILTLYRVPVTLVAFGGLFVGMLVMFSTGIYTDLKVRKILKDRLAEESRKEQGWIDRNQQDLFAQPRDGPAGSAGSGPEASREGAAGSEGAAAAFPGSPAPSEEGLGASPPGSPWPQEASTGSEAEPTLREDESDQDRSHRSISTPGSSESVSGVPWNARDAGPDPEAPGRNVTDPGGPDQEGSTPETRASDSEPGPPAPEADPWVQDPEERKETTE